MSKTLQVKVCKYFDNITAIGFKEKQQFNKIEKTTGKRKLPFDYYYLVIGNRTCKGRRIACLRMLVVFTVLENTMVKE